MSNCISVSGRQSFLSHSSLPPVGLYLQAESGMGLVNLMDPIVSGQMFGYRFSNCGKETGRSSSDYRRRPQQRDNWSNAYTSNFVFLTLN